MSLEKLITQAGNQFEDYSNRAAEAMRVLRTLIQYKGNPERWVHVREVSLVDGQYFILRKGKNVGGVPYYGLYQWRNGRWYHVFGDHLPATQEAMEVLI